MTFPIDFFKQSLAGYNWNNWNKNVLDEVLLIAINVSYTTWCGEKKPKMDENRDSVCTT